MRFVLVFLAAASIAAAQDAAPVPKITGPTKARTGDLIVLDASESTAKHFNWLVDASGVDVPQSGGQNAQQLAKQLRSLGWKVESPKDNKQANYLLLDGGKKLLLASYPGKWKVILAVADDSGVRQLPWTLVVEGNAPRPGPEPGPGPDPGPNPGPDPSPGPRPAGLAGEFYDAGLAVPGSTAAEAKAVALAFAAVHARAVAVSTTTVADMLTQTKKAMDTMLAAAAQTRWQAFGKSMTEIMAKHKLTDKSDHVKAWAAIVEGLKAIK